MKLSTKKAIYLTADIMLSIMLFACAALLCLACLSIYDSAETQMYTYEKIAAEWQKIKIPIYITLLFAVIRAVAACVERYLYPNEKDKLSPCRSQRSAVKNLYKRIDTESLSQEDNLSIAKEKKLRSVLGLVNIVLCFVSALLPLIYIASPDRYLGTTSAEVTEEVLHCLILYLICLLPAAVFYIIYSFLADGSFGREADILKKAKRLDTSSKAAQGISERAENEKLLICLRVGILAVATVFIVIGILNGGMQDVLKKAAEICAECIGLG